MLGLGRHTVTGLRTTCGWQFRDWTSSYRLFSRPRLPLAELFAVVRRAVVSELAPGAPVRAVLDDTLLRRTGLMWRAAGAPLTRQLVVIAPQGYRLRQRSKLLYRQPAFLLCTDENLAPPILIDTYLQRWGVEVNFREEKTVPGVGQAQVRSTRSVESAPAFSVAAYALLLLATHRAFPASAPDRLPRPKWSQTSLPDHISTQQALQQLRAEVWCRGLGLEHFSGFAPPHLPNTKPQKFSFPLESAARYPNA